MRAPKTKINKTKPASQLFMFSNKLNENVAHWFSGNIVIESAVSDYNFTKHKEAEYATNYMYFTQEHRGLKPFKYITIVLNYKPSGVTLAAISGEYEYMLSAQGSRGYKDLALMNSALIAHDRSLSTFVSYKEHMGILVDSLENISIPVNRNSTKSISNSLDKLEKVTSKSRELIIIKFDKLFGLHFVLKKNPKSKKSFK